MFVITFLFIFLPRSATTTCFHSCQILLDASLYCSRGRPTARGWDMAPLDTAEKMEAKAGEGQQRGPGPAAAPARPQLRAPGCGYDPFSCGMDNTEMARQSSMAMARCFSDILCDQRISVICHHPPVSLPAERHTRHLLLRGR